MKMLGCWRVFYRVKKHWEVIITIGGIFALLLIFGGVAWQVYFQRVLSAKTAKIAVRLSIVAGVVCIIAAIPAMLIGMIGNAADWQSLGLVPLGTEEAPYAVTLPYVMRHLTNPWVATIRFGCDCCGCDVFG